MVPVNDALEWPARLDECHIVREMEAVDDVELKRPGSVCCRCLGRLEEEDIKSTVALSPSRLYRLVSFP